jgi:hypothetical protein
VEPLVSRFKKAGADYGDWGEWGQHADYGMGPRRWTLLGPLPRDHAFEAAELKALSPLPGMDGWSPVIWFGHDRIDLDKHYDDPVNCAVYGFTRFTMSRSDSVRFWAGSDEGLKVWLDGELVYAHQGRRRHILGQDQLPGYIEAGEHRLLVRVDQSRGRYDFSFNICEPIDDVSYAGNRYPGVRYYLGGDRRGLDAAVTVWAEEAWEPRGEATTQSTLDMPDPVEASRTAPDSLLLQGVDQPASTALLRVVSRVSGLQQADLDTSTLNCLSKMPFALAMLGFGREGWAQEYGPELMRLCDWLGLRYHISYGYMRRESVKIIHGWLAQGYVPAFGRHDGWGLADGYREREGQVELHVVAADTVAWLPMDHDWWAPFPGNVWQNTPVFVAEYVGPCLPAAELADSVAAVALELAYREWSEYEPEPWGVRRAPAGLAAWDWWVADWERRPWTSEWAREDAILSRLQRLHQWFLDWLIDGRRVAADYFAQAARDAVDSVQGRTLRAAASAYGSEADILQELREALPGSDDAELAQGDSTKLAQIHKLRGAVREARTQERAALQALSHYLGQGDLPPAAEDPLRRKDKGVRLFVWRAHYSQAVRHLTFQGRTLTHERLTGKEAEGAESEVLAPFPRDGEWVVVTELTRGDGLHSVWVHPHPDNDWTLTVRMDDEWTRRTNAPELTVWAIPAER